MTGEEKLEKVFQYINRKAEFGKTLSVGNARRAAQFAYDAGRESAMENMPELEWKCEYPYTVDEARTPITVFHIFHNDDGFHLTGYGLGLSKIFGTLGEAKRFANEEYKNRIKQALG